MKKSDLEFKLRFSRKLIRHGNMTDAVVNLHESAMQALIERARERYIQRKEVNDTRGMNKAHKELISLTAQSLKSVKL